MRSFGKVDRCAAYRPALIDWVEHHADGPSTRSAFDHLDRCRRCEWELGEIAQTVVALQRLGAHAAAVEPPTDGWRDLRARLELPTPKARRPARSRWTLAGSMLGPAFVAVLALRFAVMPAAMPTEALGTDVPGAGIAGSMDRPMYDSGSQRLTEEIVLILGGQIRSEGHRAGSPAGVPASIDQRDLPPVSSPAIARSEPTPPRTAARS